MENITKLKEAMFYDKISNKSVKCNLCYWNCTIPPGLVGFCRIRKNIDGKLYAMTYGKPCSYEVDPIEKKPFFHFWPGSMAFSFSTIGCNFRCLHCQNWQISQASLGKGSELDMPPEKIVEMTKEYHAEGIAYTYTEPTVFFEFCYDTGILAGKQGLYNVFVTNGYATPEVLEKSKDFLDASRIDLKGEEEHYRKVCGGIKLDDVLENIKNTYKTGMHVEIITLVITGDNDNKEFVDRMANFLKEMNDEIPWHFTRFYPTWKMMDTPPTEVKTLEKMHDWAVDNGMKYVYIGNVPGHKYNHTYCPKCKEMVIERLGFSVSKINLTKDKKCPKCGEKIPIVGEVKVPLAF